MTTLRGDLGRIDDWNDPTHCTNTTSQQQVAAVEQQTDSHLFAQFTDAVELVRESSEANIQLSYKLCTHNNNVGDHYAYIIYYAHILRIHH